MNYKKFHLRFSTEPGVTSLDADMDAFKAEPRACILFTMNDTQEVECSIHFTPKLVEDHTPVPATHTMALAMYTSFGEALSQL